LSFLDNLERKIGRFAIPGLIKYVIACYIIGFALFFISPEMLAMLRLSPGDILGGQVWRLVTWVIVPPTTNILFAVILCLLYFRIGTTLEHTWGTFKFNLYFFSGVLFTIAGAFLLFFLAGAEVAASQFIMMMVSTNYVNLSMFLAFAVMFPNMELLLYFVLPVKVKYLGMVSGGITLFLFMTGNIATQMVIGASMLNFIIFFIFAIRGKRSTAKGTTGQQAFRRAAKAKEKKPKDFVHKCFECERTEHDHPELEFRYCSKCNGSLEYCQDHLFTHVHKL
jgi:hypothetical protein